MSSPRVSETHPGYFSEATSGQKRLSLMSCTDGSDGYPTLADFTTHMENYLTGKKRADRTVITSVDLEQIHHLLSDPAALRAHPNPNHRTWVKKTFFLKSTPIGTIVCHKEKGQPMGKPIAVKESMYFILKDAHASDGHGGRDKTAKAVKNTHSYIRKGLICIFLETCPTCQTRNDAAKKERKSSQTNVQTTANCDSMISFGTDFLSPISPTGFEIQRIPGSKSSSFQLTSQSANPTNHPHHFMIRRPTMPVELAQVPAAPAAASRSRYGSYPSCSVSRNSHREQDSYYADHPSMSVRHLHSPYVIMPRTAVSSNFSSQNLLNQQPEGSSLSSIALMTEAIFPNYNSFQIGPDDRNSWYDESQAFVSLSTDLESELNINLYNVWPENENIRTAESAPLLAPQPQFSVLNKFKYPFFDQPLPSTICESQFNNWEEVSPMSSIFPSQYNQIDKL